MCAPTNSWIRFLLLILFVESAVEARLHGKFIIMGDIHFDPSYPVTGDSCNIVVRKANRLRYGNYECDSPLTLMESASQKVKDELANTDFVVFAGDIVQHVREKKFLNESKVLDLVTNATRTITRIIGSSVPIIPVLGNHDYYPASQVPAENYAPFMAKLADIYCSNFQLQNSECETFRKGGYFSRLLDSDDKLLLLVLNTNLYKPSNMAALPDKHPDPVGQFAWMTNQLKEAKRKGQKVHILTHIPPGISETQDVRMFKDEYNKKFNDIIIEYADVIKGIQSAHTHTDSFRIYYKDSVPVVPLLLGPSVTPWRRRLPGFPPRNPAVRTVTFDRSGDMTDYIQYYMVLEDANKRNPLWKTEYQFTKAYSKAKDASAKSLADVFDSFQETNSSEFNSYFLRNSVQIARSSDRPTNGNYTCGIRCKAQHLCSIRHVDYGDYDRCKVVTRRKIIEDQSTGCQMKMSFWILFLSICAMFKLMM